MRHGFALSYPTRPVHLLVGYAAGGPLDISARLIAQWLSERLGQPFIVENRPGAGSNVATEAVVRAPSDGYTLLEISASNAWNAALYDNLSFDFIRDIAPVAGVRRAAASWKLIRHFRPELLPNSSLTQRPILVRSTSLRRALEAPRTFTLSCSR